VNSIEPSAPPLVGKASRSTFGTDAIQDLLEVRELIGEPDGNSHWTARVTRNRDAHVSSKLATDGASLCYVLNGELELMLDGMRAASMIPGDCAYLVTSRTVTLGARSQDCMVLELSGPSLATSAKREGSHRNSVIHAADTPYSENALRPWLRRRDLGVSAASSGWLSAALSVCGEPDPGPMGMHAHDADFHFLFVVQGYCRIDYGEYGKVLLIPGDCVSQPPGISHDVIERSDDFEVVEVTSPADFRTWEKISEI
jgi:mannose-6-phosphate isomerase-like protein (cupin superfamily)